MRKIYLLLLIAFPLLASAQVITYDTIRVSPNDERNIHRTQRQQETAQTQQGRRVRQEPILLDRSSVSGFVFDKSKLRYGANIGLSLSRNYTVLGLGPQVGYLFSNNFMGGIGVKYYYTKLRTYDYEVKSSLLGVNTFGYYYPIRFLVFFVQPELSYIWSTLKYDSAGIDDRKESGLVPSFIVGGGLRLGGSHITLNYDLIRHSRSPYPSGFFLGVSAFL
ncbi:MAG: hypothetical protein Q4G63_06785 [Bacteroidia bacterium]|nr:hypothetical protein [Bacteroidia bacterium]